MTNILLITLLGIGLLVVASRLIYTYFVNPLSSIPKAGYLAPISRLLWAFPSEHFGRITLDLPVLHERYGPLVRIGPNELSFYSIDIYKAVHSVHSNYVKDPRVYGQFVQDAHPGLFSITNAYEHSQRRRLMGQLFNRSKMYLQEDMMVRNIGAFVQALGQRVGQPVELSRACRALEADIIASFGFGRAIGAVNAWSRDEHIAMIKENDDKSRLIALLSNLPVLTDALFRFESFIYGITGWQSRSSAAMKEFDEWSSSRLSELQSNEKEVIGDHPNFISTMIKSNLPAKSALSEAKEMLGPGTDTTSATLAHILWGLAHDIEYQEALAEDLAHAEWPAEIGALEAVPKLWAAVKEGIRWAGAAAAMLPRVVPDGGVTLEKRYIPGGTIISSSPIWYLRDKRAYPSPEVYRPKRWLDQDTDSANAQSLRDEFYVPFSKGSSACIGINFAYYELYLSVSQILKSFRITIKNPGAFVPLGDAKLPSRLEWVAAVPNVNMDVVFVPRSEKQ